MNIIKTTIDGKPVEYQANNTWQFQLNQDSDLVGIFTHGTESKKVEIHILSASSNYKDFSLNVPTAFDEVTNGSKRFLIAENDDLVGIWTSGTASNKTEVHISPAVPDNGAAQYSTIGLNVVTALGEVGDEYQFLISKNRDIYCINLSGASGKIEFQCLTAASNYADFSSPNPTLTPFPNTNSNWSFMLSHDNNLIGMLKANTASNTTEIHSLNHVASGGFPAYQSYIIQSKTVLAEVGGNFTFLVDDNNDIYVIKENNTGTSTTEVHIMTESSQYQSWSLQTGTILQEVNDQKFSLTEGEIALYSGIDQTGRSWKIDTNLNDLSALSSLVNPISSFDLGLKTGLSLYNEKAYDGTEHTYNVKANITSVIFDSLKVHNEQLLLGIGLHNELWTCDSDGTWTQVPNSGSVIDVTVMHDGTILGIGIKNKLHTRATINSPWVALTNSISLLGIAIMSDGSLLGVGTDNLLHTCKNLSSDWVKVDNSGTVISVAVMNDGTLLGVDTSHNLFKSPSPGGGWAQIVSQPLLGISVLLDGTILGIDINNRLMTRATLDGVWAAI
ncbi:MAG: hypothetical protein HRT71_00245 [Flavobacteriales bacterium]|nr:hypothetical protein [Flavobacteriales bacterium]